MGYTYQIPALDGLNEEERIALALEAVRCSPLEKNGSHALSLRRASQDFNIPRSTLTSRFNGVQSRALAHESQQKLTPAEEATLVEWIKVQGRRGVPISPSMLMELAFSIAGVHVGQSWPQRFMKRHPDLKTRWSRSLEKCRANNVNKATVNKFYDILEEVVNDYSIPPENIYNMDEKGVQLGVGKRVAAIIDRDQKEVYNIEGGDRELVTVIETVSADGTALDPSVIFKGARIQSKWLEKNPCNASVSCSPNGWTDQELGLLWIQKDFEPMSKERNKSGRHRLLILDGHNSHCTFKFCDFAEKHNIIIICLPSHTTHVLQPCDVCVFGPLASSWKSEVNANAKGGGLAISKSNFLEHYANARKRALREMTITKGFEKPGIWPINRDALPDVAFEPSLNTTTQAAQPLASQLPRYVPIELLPAVLAQDSIEVPAESIISSTSTDYTPQPPPLIRQRFRLNLPSPPHHTSSRNDLREHISILHDLLRKCGMQIEADYSQMKLMDQENERLRKIVYEKQERKSKKGKDKRASAEARHMTSRESLEYLDALEQEAALEETRKELRREEREVNARNKAVEREEQRERGLDRKRAAAEKRERVQIEKEIGQWQRQMATFATFLLDEEKKRVRQREKSAKKSRSERRKQKAQLTQQLRDIGTPKRARQKPRRRRQKGAVDDDTSVTSNATTTTDGSDAASSIADGSESGSSASSDNVFLDVSPPALPQPRPRPRPIPIKKKSALQEQEIAEGNIPLTPIHEHSPRTTNSMVSEPMSSPPLNRALFLPPTTPARTPRIPSTPSLAFTPKISAIERPPLGTPGRAPRRMLRFEIEPPVMHSGGGGSSTPAGTSKRRTRAQKNAAGVDSSSAVPIAVAVGSSRHPRTPKSTQKAPMRRSSRLR